MTSRSTTALLTGLALAAGLAIAFVDTRPGWDDTAVTVGLIALAAGLASLAGLRPLLAALLIAGPLAALEWRGLGAGVVAPLAIASAAAGAGWLVRKGFVRPSR